LATPITVYTIVSFRIIGYKRIFDITGSQLETLQTSSTLWLHWIFTSLNAG